MINQIFCEIEMIKNDIKRMKDDSIQHIENQRKQEEENTTNLREEI